MVQTTASERPRALKSHRRGRMLRWASRVGAFALICLMVPFYFLLNLLAEGAGEEDLPLTVLVLAAMIVPLLLVALFVRVMIPVQRWLVHKPKRRSRQHLALSAEEAMDQDPRPPVVYLRSFQDDHVDQQAQANLLAPSDEEQLAHALSDIGPVVAVGQPSETLPLLGAARLYLDDVSWQASVSDLLAQAGLVVLRVGDTEGFRWELERATAMLPPERLLFLFPFGAYAKFREELEECLKLALPDHAEGPVPTTRLLGVEERLYPATVPPEGIWTALYFDAHKGPHLVIWNRARMRRRGKRALTHRFRLDLFPLFRQLGERAPSRTYSRLYLSGRFFTVAFSAVGLLLSLLLSLRFLAV